MKNHNTSSQVRQGLLRRTTRIAAAALSLMLLQVPLTLAHADSRLVDEVVVEVSAGKQRMVLTLNLDTPITPTRAASVRDQLRTAAQESVATTTQAKAAGLNLKCGKSAQLVNGHGQVDLQYVCLPKYAVTQWSIRLSSTVKAVITSQVAEDGMWWWRNGARQAKNSPHTEHKTYTFHGTLNPMWNGDMITYQDYFTFRHNVGGGGGGSLLFAGEYSVG